MRRRFAFCVSVFAVVLGLASGCGDEPRQESNPPTAPSGSAMTLPTVTFTVTKRTDQGSRTYEVTIDERGRWRITGDVSRTGTLRADQVRTLAAAVTSDQFAAEMVAKRGVGEGNCAAVLPDYYWVLEAGGKRATNSCPPKRPVVNHVVALIRRYTGA